MADKASMLITKMTEIETRWCLFLEKLEARMKELSEASIPELEEMFIVDEDMHKRTYYNFLQSIKAQINNINDKAEDVQDKNVSDPLDIIEDEITDMDNDKLSDFFHDLSDRCQKRGEQFGEKVSYWLDELDKTQIQDYELKYKAIHDEYQQVKDKFCCKQCSSPIPINRIYFISTHIMCPSCQTQNTFHPSTRTSELDNIGRLLAEQRTIHLLEAAEQEESREREIYDQIHNLRIERIGYEIDDDTAKIAELDAGIQQLEAQRLTADDNVYQMRLDHLKAMFEEWIKLVPELEDQNRKIYNSRLKEFERTR